MKKRKDNLKKRKVIIKENSISFEEYQKQTNKTQDVMKAIRHNIDRHQFYISIPLGRFWGGFNYMSTENSIKNKKRK